MSAEEPDYYPYNLLRFVRQASECHDALRQAYDAHLKTFGEILPTHYLGECAHALNDLLLDPATRGQVGSILRFMEDGIAKGAPEVANEIKAGFVESLPCGDQAGAAALYTVLPPRLRESYDSWFGPRTAP